MFVSIAVHQTLSTTVTRTVGSKRAAPSSFSLFTTHGTHQSSPHSLREQDRVFQQSGNASTGALNFWRRTVVSAGREPCINKNLLMSPFRTPTYFQSRLPADAKRAAKGLSCFRIHAHQRSLRLFRNPPLPLLVGAAPPTNHLKGTRPFATDGVPAPARGVSRKLSPTATASNPPKLSIR